MLDHAKAGRFAYPAINVTSSSTLVAALRGFADAGSDGIVQVSTGGGEFASGAAKDMALGATAARRVRARGRGGVSGADRVHTDHCQADKLDRFVEPLVAISEDRVGRGDTPLFQSHMFDGSALPLEENLAHRTRPLLERCANAHIILEIEAGVVGGEEDGVVGEINEKLYTTPEDMLAVALKLGLGENGRYMLAATFGNVHGVYKPGAVVLRPDILAAGQDHVGGRIGVERPFDLVFHGGSGSTWPTSGLRSTSVW